MSLYGFQDGNRVGIMKSLKYNNIGTCAGIGTSIVKWQKGEISVSF